MSLIFVGLLTIEVRESNRNMEHMEQREQAICHWSGELFGSKCTAIGILIGIGDPDRVTRYMLSRVYNERLF